MKLLVSHYDLLIIADGGTALWVRRASIQFMMIFAVWSTKSILEADECTSRNDHHKFSFQLENWRFKSNASSCPCVVNRITICLFTSKTYQIDEFANILCKRRANMFRLVSTPRESKPKHRSVSFRVETIHCSYSFAFISFSSLSNVKIELWTHTTTVQHITNHTISKFNSSWWNETIECENMNSSAKREWCNRQFSFTRQPTTHTFALKVTRNGCRRMYRCIVWKKVFVSAAYTE